VKEGRRWTAIAHNSGPCAPRREKKEPSGQNVVTGIKQQTDDDKGAVNLLKEKSLSKEKKVY